MAFYPKIDEETLIQFELVLKNMEKDKEYLNSPDCFWSNKVKDFFQKLQPAAAADIFAGEDELLVIDEQIQQIINDIVAVQHTLGNADATEKMNYFKVKTALFEKLISMRERVMNLKEINEFRTTILNFMDEVCTKDQVTDLMRKLDGVMGQ